MAGDQLARALAIAWSTKQLYPNPEEVEAFTEAVQRLGDASVDALPLSVGPDGFEYLGEVIVPGQAAATRLNRALFGLNVATVAVIARPTPAEVIAFFDEIENPDAGTETIDERLAEAGVDSIRVRQHDLLEDAPDESEREAEAEAEAEAELRAELLEESEASDKIVEEVTAIAGESPTLAAQDMTRRYLAAWEQCDEDDWVTQEKVVQNYVDAFNSMPEDVQIEFLQAALEDRQERALSNFLDQFASSELAGMAGQLAESSMGLLLDYARVMSEEESRRTELLTLMTTEADLDRARGGIAGLVGERLKTVTAFEQERQDAATAVRGALTAEVAEADHGLMVANAVMRVEGRRHRRVRFGKVWSTRVTRLVKSGNFRRAISWLEAVKGVDEMDPDERDSLLAAVASPGVLQIVASAGDDPDAAELLEWFASHAGHRIVEALGEEEDAGRRRLLIDVVAQIAAVDLKSVISALKDPRWYVVRNVVLALGKSKREAAVRSLGPLLNHGDHRVRIETLRALVSCGGSESVAYLTRGLRDDHVRVRSTAVDLLAALEDDAAQNALATAARNEDLPAEERLAVIDALGKTRSAIGLQALEALASSRGKLLGSGRTLRSAAREALGKRT